MVCSKSTGSRLARYWMSAALISSLVASCWISPSQGVVGGLYRLTVMLPSRVLSISLNEGWKTFT